jgi:hypothetical protein
MVDGVEGIAVFDALHRRHRASDAMLYAFDLLELNGKDLRPLPLGDRKAKLARHAGCDHDRTPNAACCDYSGTARPARRAGGARLPVSKVVGKFVALTKVGPVSGLDQGQEPGQPGDGALP